MLIRCILVALVYMLGVMDTRMFGANRWNFPICFSAVVGLVCGDLTTGIIMGVELQLIFLGFVNIGMSVMPDSIAGTALAVSFTILSGLESSAAIAMAMPITLLFQPIGIVKNVVLNYFNVKGDEYAKKANAHGLTITLHVANILQGLVDFTLMFVALYAGSTVVQAVVDAIPPIVMACLNKTAQVLPALGVAYLMSFVTDSFTMPFVILGFALASYLGLDALGISLIGGVIAVIYFNIKNLKKGGE